MGNRICPCMRPQNSAKADTKQPKERQQNGQAAGQEQQENEDINKPKPIRRARPQQNEIDANAHD